MWFGLLSVVVAVAFVKSDGKVHRRVVGMTLPIGMLQRPNKIVGVKYPPSAPPKGRFRWPLAIFGALY